MTPACWVALAIVAAGAAATAQDPSLAFLASRADAWAAHAARAPLGWPEQDPFVLENSDRPVRRYFYHPESFYDYPESYFYPRGYYDLESYDRPRSSYPVGMGGSPAELYERDGYHTKAQHAPKFSGEDEDYEGSPKPTITEAEVLAAQQAWGAALVSISMTYDNMGLAVAKAVAGEIIDRHYGYQFGPVLFKPTLAFGNQTFRTSRKGCLAYFVGNDTDFPTDSGFALKGWRKYSAVNAAVFLHGDTATTQGNVFLTDKNGAVTIVDKTWMFVKFNVKDSLRIMVHHSSLPYAPPAATTATTTSGR